MAAAARTVTLLAMLCALLTGNARAASPTPGDMQEIQQLIASVETLQGAHFVRNGSSYDGTSAAAHLRLKLQKAGSRVLTADDFIRVCASVSSMSGQPYEIRFDDGRTVSAESFLRGRLAALRLGHAPGE